MYALGESVFILVLSVQDRYYVLNVYVYGRDQGLKNVLRRSHS